MRAVVDVGSNSVLLLIAEKEGDQWKTIAETAAVTGLGKGVKQSGQLSEESMQRTLAAMEAAFETAANAGVTDVVAAGTMALRIAHNSSDFLDRAAAQRTPLTVLSGEQEAELGFLAVADDPFFAEEDRLSIIDPGGNSTELVTAARTATGWDRTFARSFPIGALALRDDLWRDSPVGPREVLAAVGMIDDIIGMHYMPQQSGRAVVLGATGTNLVTMREQMTEWQPELVHGQVLDYEDVSKEMARLSALTDEERGKIIGLEPGREFTIHAGALILERFLQAIHALEVTVSVRGWRHALLERGAEAIPA